MFYPAREVLNGVVLSDPEINAVLKGATAEQFEMAIICGAWNGLIEFGKGIPGLIKLVGDIKSGTISLSGMIKTMSEFQNPQDSTRKGWMEFAKHTLGQLFPTSEPVLLVHNAVELTVAVGLGFVTGSNVAQTAGKFGIVIKVISALNRIEGAAFTLVGSALTGSIKLLSAAGGRLVADVRDGALYLEALIDGAWTPYQVQLAGAGGPPVILRANQPVPGDEAIFQMSQEGGASRIVRSSRDVLALLRRTYADMGLTPTQIDQLFAQFSDNIPNLEGLAKVLEPHQNLDDFLKLIDDLGSEQGRELAFRLAQDGVEEGGMMVDAWSDFVKTGKTFSKIDPKVLDRYLKLSVTNKSFILQFSDIAPSSTLARFLDDCDDAFIKVLNGNPEYLECFVSHKNEPKWNLDQFVQQAEEILNSPSLPEDQIGKLTKWVDHSSDATRFGKVTAKGIELNKNIVGAIFNRSGKFFDDFAAHLDIDPTVLGRYEIYVEVPLITEGGFMKADLLLVKRNIVTNKIENVIVVENKLSGGTNYTTRQKEGWKKLANNEDLVLQYSKTGIDSNGDEVVLTATTSLRASRIKPIKISDHGESNISNTVFSHIPVNNWKNYIYSPK